MKDTTFICCDCGNKWPISIDVNADFNTDFTQMFRQCVWCYNNSHVKHIPVVSAIREMKAVQRQIARENGKNENEAVNDALRMIGRMS